MKHSEALRQIQNLAGKADDICDLLAIGEFSAEEQIKVTERFSEMVLNRMLLSVPEEHVTEVKSAVQDEHADLNEFVLLLQRCIPEFNRCIQDSMNETLPEFQQARMGTDHLPEYEQPKLRFL
ncbi:MAG TPA: hypothetical protein VN420_05525 [Candidatus Fimivivens sp.]|nr:hypothetical protein [Candidatus Fimivivens sp.]